MALNKLNSPLAWLLLGLIVWVVLRANEPAPRLRVESPIETAPSVEVQLGYSLGDRYLAANIGTWRATMVGAANLPEASLTALAKIQESVSWLNPANEDNYYMAQAFLPWEGFVDQTQTILLRAIDARPDDPLPPFYFAFNQLNFYGDVSGAVATLRAAEKMALADEYRANFRVLADRWGAKSEDLAFPIRAMEKMLSMSRSPALRRLLSTQLRRMRGLVQLREAALVFQKKHGRAPESLLELTAAVAADTLPDDTLGGGYGLRDGWVYLAGRAQEGR